MNSQAEPQIVNQCRQLAIISASIGTTIFLFFLLFRGETPILGLGYLLIAALIKGIFFTVLAISCYTHKQYWRKIVATMIFMLANIPLSIFYCFMALKLF